LVIWAFASLSLFNLFLPFPVCGQEVAAQHLSGTTEFWKLPWTAGKTSTTLFTSI